LANVQAGDVDTSARGVDCRRYGGSLLLTLLLKQPISLLLSDAELFCLPRLFGLACSLSLPGRLCLASLPLALKPIDPRLLFGSPLALYLGLACSLSAARLLCPAGPIGCLCFFPLARLFSLPISLCLRLGLLYPALLFGQALAL